MQMERKLAAALGDHGHHTGIVRSGAEFAEIDLFTLDEELDAEDTAPAQSVGDTFCHLLRFFQRTRVHLHRLP
ncbi:hypothetical protein D3C81_1994890 [compost metagenome]